MCRPPEEPVAPRWPSAGLRIALSGGRAHAFWPDSCHAVAVLQRTGRVVLTLGFVRSMGRRHRHSPAAWWALLARCRRIAHALELAVQRSSIETEHLCGDRLVAAHGFEHLQNLAPLDLVHPQALGRVVRLDADACGPVVSDLFRQVVNPDLIELRERDRSFDAI